MTTLNGMAVLFTHFSIILLTYRLFEKIDWRHFFTNRNAHFAQPVCVLVSIAVGHLVASFIITILETIRNIILSSLL